VNRPVPAIGWGSSLEEAQAKAAGRGVPVLLYFSAAPECLGSLALQDFTFEDPRVGEFVNDRFVPVRLLLKEHRDLAAQQAVAWTPALLLTDENGAVHFRIDGYLPATELLAHLSLGIGRFELAAGRADLAAERLAAVIAHHAGTEMAAEAAWWLAIAHFRQMQDSVRLRAEWTELARAHPRSAWAARTRIPAAAGRTG
jgi:hypothetical protein